MVSRVKACKNTAVYFLESVLRQNELSSCFIALKKDPLVLVCLQGMFFRTKSIPYLLLLSFHQKTEDWTHAKIR